MKEYGENKIFVEGKSDKIFIDFLLLHFFKIDDKSIVVDVEGKDKLKNSPLLINERRRSENSQNLIIFDTDSIDKKGGREERLKELNEIKTLLEIEFSIFLLPFNDENEGMLENLINTCFKEEFNFFDDCWNSMIACIESSEIKNLNIPAQHGFIYSKIDLFRRYQVEGIGDDKLKIPYQSLDIWNFERDKNKNLDKLLKFIENNLFNN
ncbi:hypothetical protein SAMN05421846_10486 [Chryseobacterium taeanense]|uniref:DUF4435 domain-containing protein n=1 Tax=Chryseobacterium taeanense TaxID=311334 RepID=A0A1G8HUR8_9FLAO|nr:DUF3226 domain-containing protein [Chryseobacterium taeanense]SDI10388.1 hypothetical protein SAMN05421846_10486 [Chryseobacterium taeanense]